MHPVKIDPTWPAAKIEKRAVSALLPYARNSRIHTDDQVAKIAASIRQFGWTVPVLIAEDGTIIAGHGRVMAAKSLGIEIVPVMVARRWSDEQRRAYTIADNHLTEIGGWDQDLLRIELGELAGAGFDVGVIGFDQGQLDAILAGLPDPAAPADPEEQDGEAAAPARSLAERFGVAPFTVLRAAEGWWQDRKRAWLSLGIQSEVGRGENLLKMSDTMLEPDPAKRAAKREIAAVVAGNGWGNGGPARRDPAFYAKKRAWEQAHGRKISTTEFREQHWDGAA